MLDRFRHGSFGSDEEAPNGVGGGGDSKGVPAPAAATFPATADEGGEYGDDGDGDGDVWDTEGDTESQLTAPAAWAFFSLAEDVVYLPGSRLGLLITHPLAPSPAVPPPPAAAYVPSTRMLPPPAATSAAASAAAAAISALSPRLSGAAGGGVSVGGGGSSYVGHDDGSLQLALAIDDEGGALVMHSDVAAAAAAAVGVGQQGCMGWLPYHRLGSTYCTCRRRHQVPPLQRPAVAVVVWDGGWWRAGGRWNWDRWLPPALPTAVSVRVRWPATC